MQLYIHLFLTEDESTMTKIIDFLRNIKFFFINLWIFKKQLWNFRSWDHSYNLALYLESLKLLKNTMEENDRFINSKKYVFQIHKTILVLERIVNDNYHDMYFTFSGMVTSDIENNLVEILDTGVRKKENIPLSTEAFYKRKDQKQIDYEYFIRMIEKYSQSWWD